MSEQYVAAIDQGTTSHPVHDLQPRRAASSPSTRRSTSRSSRGPAGSSTTPIEIWNNTRDGRRPARWPRPTCNAARHRRGRHHQPARDRAGLGPDHRRAGLQRDRLAGHPHRRHLQAARRPRRRRRAVQGQGRAAAGHLLLRARRSRWILDNVEGAREKAEAGDLVFGNMDTWVLWNMTGGVDGGLHVTDPTNASRTMLMDLDTLSWDADIADGDGHPAVDAAGDPVVAPRCTATVRERGVARRRADRRHPRRPAGGHLRPGLPSRRARPRTPTAPATSCCSTPAREKVPSKNGLLTTVCYKIGDQRDRLRARGLDRGHRLAGAVAARQPRA